MKRLPLTATLWIVLEAMLLTSFGIALKAEEEDVQPYPSQQTPREVRSRVEKLLGQLTLDEKISLLAGDGFDGMSTVAIPRLGIPKLVMSDGPQGIRAHGPACSFPSIIALAATWNTALARLYGEAVGREARARGIHIQLAPGVNIARTPLNGRNFEYFGEDPYLTGKMASSWIRGIQSQGVASTVKHFVGNDEEWRRMEINTTMNEQTLREIYLSPFEDAIKSGGAWAVMSAYNRLNGVPSTENPRLQQEILRDEWNFPGLVMSDWWATESPQALAKGLDLEMPMNYQINIKSIHNNLDNNVLTTNDINQSVQHYLTMAISMGFLDRVQQKNTLPLDSPENAKLALDVAVQSIVLLKNSPAILPLQKNSLRRVVIYGPNGQDTPGVGGGSGEVTPFRKISFFQGIRNALPKGTKVLYAPVQDTAPFSPFGFLDFPEQPESLPAKVLNVRKMVCTSDNGQTRIQRSRKHSIEVFWNHLIPPDGVPKGREARIIWDADIMAPVSGEYEIRAEGHPEIRLGHRELGSPESYVTRLEKDVPVPLRITANEVGRGEGKVSLQILPVQAESAGLAPAKTADVAIVCVGLNPDVEGEGYDRGFSLPLNQQKLIRDVSKVNPRTIVVLSGGAAVDMRDWIGSVPAVLQTWYLGQNAGTALAAILFGDANPSGRLPCTFDRDITENPAYLHYPGGFPEGKDLPEVDYHEGIFYGYRGYDKAGKDPLFPFGYGLSYTDFKLSGMVIAQNSGGGHTVTVRVDNTGKRPGATVVQLYISLPQESTPRPLRELKGFQRVELNPGESRILTLPLPQDSLRYWHPLQNHWVQPEGPVTVEVGFSERDIRQQESLGTTSITPRTGFHTATPQAPPAKFSSPLPL